MTDDARLVATSSQTVGPFFHFALTPSPNGRMVDRFPPGGEPIRLRVSVTDADRVPVADAMIELWQDGVFGRLPTAEDGSCEFETVRPAARAPGVAPHLNVCLFARGLLRHIFTRVYFDGDPLLASDPVLALVPADRRGTLIAHRDADAAQLWRFAIKLQGDDETVFFDV